LSFTTSKLLKLDKKPKKVIYQESRLPQARNPTYQKPVNVGCPYCTDKCGRKKNFRNLYCLYRHFTHHHPAEPRYKDLTMTLASMIIDGTLL